MAERGLYRRNIGLLVRLRETYGDLLTLILPVSTVADEFLS